MYQVTYFYVKIYKEWNWGEPDSFDIIIFTRFLHIFSFLMLFLLHFFYNIREFCACKWRQSGFNAHFYLYTVFAVQ